MYAVKIGQGGSQGRFISAELEKFAFLPTELQQQMGFTKTYSQGNTERPTLHVLQLYGLEKQANIVKCYTFGTKHEVNVYKNETRNFLKLPSVVTKFSNMMK